MVDQPLQIAGLLAFALALVGSAYMLFAACRLRALFWTQAEAPASPDEARAPAVTVLKPLHGDEPGLEAALASVLDQDYAGEAQVIFGLQDPADPALAVVRRLRAAHPDRDICVIVDPRPHGTNRKVANLINMAAHARHETVVIADNGIVVPQE